MANQQLVGYIKEQFVGGVSEDMVKNALKTAGWPDVDIADGIKAAKAPAVSVPVSAPITPAMSATRGNTLNAAAKSESVAQKMSVLDIREAIGGKDELLNNVAAAGQKQSAAKNDVVATKPIAAGVAVGASVATKIGFLSKISIPEIVMGIIILGFLGGGVWYYMDQSGSSAKLQELSSQNAALNNQIAGMTKTNGELSAEVDSLKASIKTLADENASWKNDMLFLVAVPGSSVAADGITVTVKGALTAAKTGQYILTTANGVAINIKNYKDAKVDALLKPLLSSSVTISGTHTAGSRDLTVTEVNGQPIATTTVPGVPATP